MTKNSLSEIRILLSFHPPIINMRDASESHLHRFHHMKVGHILVSKFGMLGQVDIFLGHHDSLLEEELIDSNAILLGHQHLRPDVKSIKCHIVGRRLYQPPLKQHASMLACYPTELVLSVQNTQVRATAKHTNRNFSGTLNSIQVFNFSA